MKKYIYSSKSNGVHIFDIQKQYEKIKIAAKIIASIPDPSTIIVKIMININNYCLSYIKILFYFSFFKSIQSNKLSTTKNK